MQSSELRNMIFVSHAWEDFEFTKWLALQLAKEGYGVWCDVTKLLGGENWPKEINSALQNRTARFFFILSRSSNTKPDPLGELETARKVMRRENISNFIVPLKLDAISRDEVDYRLQEIQSISFESSWADGLSNTLKLLREEHVQLNPSFTPMAVNEWWRKYGTDACQIKPFQEILSSNRFPILSHPDIIHAHFVSEEPRFAERVKYPVVPFRQFILSFADRRLLETDTGIKSRILESHSIPVSDMLAGTDQLVKRSRTGEYCFIRLLNQAFQKGVEARGLGTFRLSKGDCFYFHERVLTDGRIKFTGEGELNSRIKLWGKSKEESWHWAIYVRTEREPVLHYAIQSHVLVQGRTGLHAAPKGLHKSWRNDKWRDRLKASVLHLAQEKNEVELNATENQGVRFSKVSIQYVSPDSYDEPKEQEDAPGVSIDG